MRNTITVGAISSHPGPSGPTSITTGPDGALWFAGGCIGRMTTTGLVTNVYRMTTAENRITMGPDRALWFTTNSTAASGNPLVSTGATIDRISVPATPSPRTLNHLAITTYHLSTGSPGNLTIGPDGALWFPITAPPAIGRITTAGVITEFPVPSCSSPTTLTTGPDGALWYTTFDFPTPGGPGQASVSRMTTLGVVTVTYSAPFPSGATDIETGPDGALWFTSNTGFCTPASGGCELYAYRSIVRMTTTGVFTDYPVPEPEAYGTGPQDITTGPDGGLWFTSFGLQSAIGRITTSGVITNCTSSALGAPYGITMGPDGARRSTNSRAHTIGRRPDPTAFAC